MRNPKIDYIKGIAITAVLINHYLNRFVSGDQSGYANGFVALFFLTSGYLSFLSLNINVAKHSPNVSHIFKFLFSRFTRLYPLYWTALAIGIIFANKYYPFYEFTLYHSSGIFWFLSALVQCYLIAYFLYLFIEKKALKRTFFLLFILFLLLNFFYTVNNYFSAFVNNVSAVTYQGLFLSHILLFATGMLAAKHLKSKNKKSSIIYFYLLVGIMIFVLHLSKTYSGYSSVAKSINLLFLVVSAFAFINFLIYKFSLPLKRIIILLGKYSFSIYLLHEYFYAFINKLGIVQKDSPVSLIVVFITLPFFLFTCILTEKTYFFIAESAKSLTNTTLFFKP